MNLTFPLFFLVSLKYSLQNVCCSKLTKCNPTSWQASLSLSFFFLQEMIVASSKFTATEVCTLVCITALVICQLKIDVLKFDAMKLVSSQSTKEKRFLYDIVANGRNGIDVDKYGPSILLTSDIFCIDICFSIIWICHKIE